MGLEEIRMGNHTMSYSRDCSGQVVRIFVLAVGALLFLGAFSSLMRPVGASAGMLSPPHSDYGEDTDMPPNGLYNYLHIDVSVNVTLAGQFFVMAELYDNSGMNLIDSQFGSGILPLGIGTIQVSFMGTAIRSSGYDGPYMVDIYLLDDLFALLDIDTHVTGTYNATDFEASAAYFTPPHKDYGQDNNGDLLYDLLIVTVVVSVNVSGFYELDATLWERNNLTVIEWSYNYTYLNAGNQTIDVAFTGYVIRNSGFDGPYWVDLMLFDDMFNLLDTGGHYTSPYLFTEFQDPPAVFLPPHGDKGVDTDGNLLFEYLLLGVGVDVNVAGTYTVYGFGPEVGFAQNETWLNAGPQALDLYFYGFQIYSNGVDGPYTIDLQLVDDGMNLLDNDTHITGPYLYTEFEPDPPIRYLPPYADDGIDSDGDTLFNYLRVQTRYFANASGNYNFYADIWDLTHANYIATVNNASYRPSGAGQVDFLFNGGEIYDSGIDGPYWVDLYVTDEFWTVLLDNDTHITGPYLYTDFDPPSARFAPPHTDYGLDSTMPPDGLYEQLIVNASVFVNDPGWYQITGLLLDPMFNPIGNDMKFVNLTAGFHNATLTYPGIDIYNNGQSGPYFVSLDLYEAPLMGPFVWLENMLHMCNWYNYSDFASSPPALLYGNVWNPGGSMLPNVNVAAVNYSFGWFVETTTDGSGYFQIDAFNGDFFVVYDHGNYQSNFTWVNVNGSTEASKMLEPVPPNPIVSSAVFPDWDNMTLDVIAGMSEDNVTFRFFIDTYLGNMDGYIDQAENDLFWSINPMPPIPIPPDTNGMMHVDSIWYDLTPGTETYSYDLTGPVDSVNPITIGFGGNYTSNSTIPPFPGHLMELYVDYDTGTETFIIYGQAPLAWRLASYDPVANVTITGVGTPNFVVDPLVDSGSVWVNLTFDQAPPDTLPPEISGVTINGLSVATYGLLDLPPIIYINATIDDAPTGSRPIGGANFTEGLLNFPGVPMNPIDGTFDSPTEDVTGAIVSPPVGQTFYCVYAWDATPNYNMTGACAELNIVDDFGPDVTSVRIDGFAVQNYQLSTAPLTATLTAIIDDSARGNADVGGANYTTPTVSSWPGIMMNPFDGAFDSPTEDVTVAINVPTTAGTFNYFVHGWDIFPNYSPGAPSAQINIADDVAPAVINVLLNGAPTATVMPGTPVVLDAIIDDSGGHGDTSIAGANFTVGPGNWPGQWMLPTDGMFDTATEGATETIDTTGWFDGVYQICVYGWDSVPNYNTTDVCASLTISSADNLIPEVSNVLINGSTNVIVGPGTPLNLTATVDDSAMGGSDIGGANYTIDGDWMSSTPMLALDGTFDSSAEDVYVTIDTTGWADAMYQVCVHGWDVAPNYNITFTACGQITIQTPDTTPPNIINVLLDGASTLTVTPGTNVALSATIDDSVTGNGIIGGANYTIDMTWPGSPMNPVDLAFDEDVEDVAVNIDTTGWPDGTYQICVHGWDDVPNYHSAFDACAQLTIQSIPPDTTPPNISNLQEDPNNPGPGDDVRISATVTDDDQVSGVWIEIRDPSGTAIGNNTMTYDSVNDEYYYVDSYADLGIHTYVIWATDPAGNWASASGDFEVFEKNPPTIEVTVSDPNPEVGDTVTFEADVEDESDIDDVRITITDEDGNVVVNNRQMTEDGGIYTYDYEFDQAGVHTYAITAIDENGNSAEVASTITVKEPAAPSFFQEYWWLILLIVIIIVVLLLVVMMLMRKPKVREFEPIPEMDMALEEEPPMEEMPEEPYEEIPEAPSEPPIDEEVPEEPPPPEDYIEGEQPPEPPEG